MLSWMAAAAIVRGRRPEGILQIGWRASAHHRRPAYRIVADGTAWPLNRPNDFNWTGWKRRSASRCSSPIRRGTVRARLGRLRLTMMRAVAPVSMAGLTLEEAPGPARIIAALSAYFGGDLTALIIKWRVGGTPFQRSVWGALHTVRAGIDDELRRVRGAGWCPQSGSRGRSCQRRQSRSVRHSLSSAGRIRWIAGGYGGGLERKRWLLAARGCDDKA